MTQPVRIVFACSGSPENLAALSQLAARGDWEVVAVTLDIGQTDHLDAVRHAAIKAGAVRAHVLDVRDEFARECLLGTQLTGDGVSTEQPLSPELIARALVDRARVEGATTIAHAGDARTQAAITAASRALDPAIAVVAADRLPRARHERLRRTTLWGRTVASGAPAAGFASDTPAHLELSFERGLPVAVNGIPMKPAELVESLTTIAGHHGVGRVIDAVTGTACDAPAAVVLNAVHAALGDETLRAQTTTVRVELFKGHHRVLTAQRS